MASCQQTKECIDCIRKVLPDFDTGSTNDRELCEVLMDGEVLCALLTELSNGRITYDSSNSHVLAKKNIAYFLGMCREEFGLQAQDMFDPDDLLKLSNPERVVMTIIRLIKSKREAVSNPTRVSGLLQNVVKEICDHEIILVKKLRMLLLYRYELLGILSEWSEDLVSFIFKYTEQMYIVHKELHEQLESLAQQGCEEFCQKLNVLFAEMEPKLSIYTFYFTHLPTAHCRMDAEFEKSPELLSQISLLNKHFNSELGFRSMYDAPIRQPTNYLQLLTRLHKTAQKEIPEAAKCVELAIQRLKDFLDRVNAYKKQAEQLAAAREVLAQVRDLPAKLARPEDVGLHLSDHMFNVVQIVKDKKKEAGRQCLCILTTKQLIVATKAKKESQPIFWFGIPVVNANCTLQAKKIDKSTLEVTWKGNKVIFEDTKPKCCGLEKLKLMLDETKSEVHPTGWDADGHKYELKTFPEGTECSRCFQELTGVVMQGYSCLHCSSGKQFHLKCLRPQKPPSPTFRRGSVPAIPTAPRPTALNLYHGNVGRDRAREILAKREPGTFLIRDSRTGGKALSLRTDDDVEHINIFEANGQCALGNEVCWFRSMDAMVEFYRTRKLSIHFSTIDCSLANGVPADSVEKRDIKKQKSLKEEVY